MGLPARLSPTLEDEAGFSLIELLVAMAAAMVIFLAAVTFIDVGFRSQTDTGNRVHALGDQRVALERMTRELRQGRTLSVPSPGVVESQVYVPSAGAVMQVRYDCSTANECRRYEYPVGGTLPSTYQQLLTGVESASFTPAGVGSANDYVAIEIWVTLPDRELPIALSDGVHLRNQVGA